MLKKLQLFFNLNCLWLVSVILLTFNSCKKDEAPVNPYDKVDYSTGVIADSIPDPTSITGLHKNIFSKRCANPGCHDGTFEPDFRTVQSTWSTLVYLNVNKTTVDSISYFNTRVLPGDFQNSFLYERLTTTTSDYMPSNSSRLSSTEIGYIKTWNQNGAKDINGNSAQKPNLPPTVLGYNAFDSSFNRIDTIRFTGNNSNAFIVHANSLFYLPFLALDTADGSNATDPAFYTVHKIKFSTQKDDFSSAISVNCTWLTPIPYAVWQATVNTSNWSVGTKVYFRIYVNDGFQTIDAEFPKTNSFDFYKTYYAFIIQ